MNDLIEKLNLNCEFRQHRAEKNRKWKLGDFEHEGTIERALKCWSCGDGTGYTETCENCDEKVKEYKIKTCEKMLAKNDICVCKTCFSAFQSVIFSYYDEEDCNAVRKKFPSENCNFKFELFDTVKAMRFVRHVVKYNNCANCLNEIEFDMINFRLSCIESQLKKNS